MVKATDVAPRSNFLGLALELCDVDGELQCLELTVLRPPMAVDSTVVRERFIDSVLADELASAWRAPFRGGLYALG